MNISADIHTHTNFSDGKCSPREMLLSAIGKGLDVYGFSDHAHMKIASHWMMAGERTDNYIKEINSLKAEFSDRIKALCGIEHDVFSDIALAPFDYVIGSVHYIKCGNVFCPVDATKNDVLYAIQKYFGGDPYAYCGEYYSQLARHAENPEVDVVGHFDLVEKFNDDGSVFDRTSPKYIKPAVDAMEKLNAAGKIFEINTGAMFRVGRSVPYPSEYLLRTLNEMHGKIVFSSDAHSTDAIAFAFDRASALAEKCGFSDFDRTFF